MGEVESFNEGLNLGKEQGLQNMRKLLYVIVLSLDKEELKILSDVLSNHTVNTFFEPMDKKQFTKETADRFWKDIPSK